MRPAVMSHGAKAHGDGWLADMLIRRPSSLRELKIKNGDTFPREEIAQRIDGRTMTKARSPHEMPASGVRSPSGISNQRRAARARKTRSRSATGYKRWSDI